MAQIGYYRCIVPASSDKDIKEGDLVVVTEAKGAQVEGVHKIVNDSRWTFRIPLVEFESQFEFEPNGAALKSQELVAAMEELDQFELETAALGVQLGSLQSTSNLVLGDGGMSPATETPETAESALVVTNDSGEKALAIKSGAAELRRNFTRASKDLAVKQQRMKDLLAEKRILASAKLCELQETMKVVGEVIQCVNVYLGQDEEVTVVKEGAPAPIEEVIHVHQEVVYMDEESAAFADFAEQGGIDFTKLDKFDEWLCASMDHVRAIAPEPRCVVALKPRRTEKKYGFDSGNALVDAMAEAAANARNFKTYILIRNGDRLFRVLSLFDAGERLYPNHEDYEKYFVDTEYDWQSRKHKTDFIRPGDPKYMDALKRAEGHQRHYLQALLLIQGLLDRTKVFHPIMRPRINVLDPAEYADVLVFVRDGERALPAPGPSFTDWLEGANASLDVGHRVVGHFGWSFGGRDDDERVSPKGAGRPDSNKIYTIEAREGENDFKILFDREGHWWDGHQRRTYDKRASARIKRSDPFVLNVDAADEASMRWFIDSKKDRKNYADMIPLMRVALALKEKERQDEAPFRELMVKILTQETGDDEGTCGKRLDGVIHWWKFTNRTHRALLSDDAKAYRMITDAYKVRRKREVEREAGEKVGAAVLAAVVAHHASQEVLGVFHIKENEYVALVRANAANLFVHESKWRTNKGVPRYAGTDEWKLVETKRTVRWAPIMETEVLKGWQRDGYRRNLLSDPEVLDLLPKIVAMAEDRQRKKAAEVDRKGSHREEGMLSCYEPMAVLYHAQTCTFTVVANNLLADPEEEFTPHADKFYRSWSTNRMTVLWERKITGLEPVPNWYRSSNYTYRYNPDMHARGGESSGKKEVWEDGGTLGEVAAQAGNARFIQQEEAAVVLWRHPENIERFYATLSTIASRDALCSELMDRVNTIVGAIEGYLYKGYLDDQHTRFLGDGGLEEDWADHKSKKCKGHVSVPREFRERVTFLVDAGLTVAETNGLTTDHIYAESNRRGWTIEKARESRDWREKTFDGDGQETLRSVPIIIPEKKAEDDDDE